MDRRYPTREGIAVSVHELALPDRLSGSGRHRETNNHHAHFTARQFGRLAVTQYVRDLACHQYVMPMDVHEELHRIYAPPKFPTEEQAAREVINAYERGEQFKRRTRGGHGYQYQDIPLELVDHLIAQYALRAAVGTALPYSPQPALLML